MWNLFSPELFNLFSCGDHVFHDLGSLQFDGLVNEDGSEFFCPNPIASLRSSIKCLLKIFGDPGGRVVIYHAGFQSQHCIKPGRVVWPEGRRIKSPRLSSATWRVQGQSGLRKTLLQRRTLKPLSLGNGDCASRRQAEKSPREECSRAVHSIICLHRGSIFLSCEHWVPGLRRDLSQCQYLLWYTLLRLIDWSALLSTIWMVDYESNIDISIPDLCLYRNESNFLFLSCLFLCKRVVKFFSKREQLENSSPCNKSQTWREAETDRINLFTSVHLLTA